MAIYRLIDCMFYLETVSLLSKIRMRKNWSKSSFLFKTTKNNC